MDVSLAGSKVLITGATGFIGNRLVEVLGGQNGVELRALIHQFMNAARLARYPVKMFGGNITDPESVSKAMEGCDIVFHLAYGSEGTDAERRWATVEGTKVVCEAALRHRVKRIVYTSTISVYGDTPVANLDETAARKRSGDAYADSKLEAENLMLQYCQTKKVPGVILQPTIVYGPYSFWSRWPIEQLKTGTVVLPGDGRGVCNAVYVDDVVAALLQAARSQDVEGEVFLISSNEHPTWLDYYRSYARFIPEAQITFENERRLHALVKKQNRSSALMLLKRAARSSRFRKELLMLLVQLNAIPTYRLLRSVFPQSIRARATSALKMVTPPNQRPACLPLLPHLPLFRSQARVNIGKAIQKLDYQPKHGLEHGVPKTEAWAKWFGMVK